MEKIKCPFCNKEYTKMGLGTHIWRTHGTGKDFDPNKRIKSGELTQWNKGKKVKEETKEKIRKTLKNRKGKPHSVETKKILSIKAKERKFGGLTKNGGRSKKGYYKNIWCDSSWELAWVIYNLDHNIKFKRNTKGFKYFFEDKEFNYYPDFILENNTYVEIKGWDSPRNQAKLKMFPHEIKVLYYKDLKEIFDYVETKYGKNYIKLYL